MRSKPSGQRVDAQSPIRSGNLDQTQLCPVRVFPNELGINGDKRGAGQHIAKRGEIGCIGNERAEIRHGAVYSLSFLCAQFAFTS